MIAHISVRAVPALIVSLGQAAPKIFLVGALWFVYFYFMGGQCYVRFNFLDARFVLNCKLNCGGRILEWACQNI